MGLASSETNRPATSPSFAESFRFPIASAEGRRDVLIGGLLVMFTLPIGFIMCMGHRLHVLRRLHLGIEPAFYGYRPWWFTFRRGLRAVVAIGCYLVPGLALLVAAILALSGLASFAIGAIGLVLFAFGLYALPGGMTHNAIHDDMTVLVRPDLAMRIAIDGGFGYLRAWVIDWTAVGIAYASLLLFVIPFFFTSVWAWSVAGHAFTRALIPDLLPENEL